MSWSAKHRKKLEEFAGEARPLNQAIRAALDRIEDLEVIVQEFVDNHAECQGSDQPTRLASRAMRLLEGRSHSDAIHD